MGPVALNQYLRWPSSLRWWPGWTSWGWTTRSTPASRRSSSSSQRWWGWSRGCRLRCFKTKPISCFRFDLKLSLLDSMLCIIGLKAFSLVQRFLSILCLWSHHTWCVDAFFASSFLSPESNNVYLRISIIKSMHYACSTMVWYLYLKIMPTVIFVEWLEYHFFVHSFCCCFVL